ncbi:MAG: efflux RND transporter periplasmic adaptor subunit [Candidatus Acidiferrales bacterium]|jgi:RND family efflux transporter MFP subunit
MQKHAGKFHQQNAMRLRAITSIVVAGLFLSGCSKKEAPEAAPTVTVQVDAAEKEPIQRKVIADAILYPLEQAAIVPKVSSPVKKFYVDRGSHVKAGQLLAELENQDLAGAQLKSQGGFQQAEASYSMQLQKTGQDAKLARQTLDAAQKLFDSREALYKEGAIAAKDVEESRVALTQAQNQYDLAEKQADLRVAEAQLNAARGDTASAEAQLSYTRITSPIDGVVTDRPVYAGETPAAGSPVITIMNLSRIIARAHISQGEAYSLKAGDAATISVPGQNAAVKGKVTLISPALDPNSTTVEVWVQAPNPGDRLRPGSSVRVTMIGETVPSAIVIPMAALLTDPDGVTSVIVLDGDNVPHKKKVKTGIRDAQNIQVTDGLQGGERVVTLGAFELDKEDEDVLAKTKIQVQAPKMPDEDEDQ